MELDDLIGEVEGDDALHRLSSAMGVKAELDELADALIGHFVEEARRAGRSWSEIGAAMGVSKQAAQQRHTSERPSKRERMPWTFGTRFTERAKTAVREAQRQAAELGHGAIGTEHLLLGILGVPNGIGGRVLLAHGVTREDVMSKIGSSGAPRSGNGRHLPFTPRAESAMERSLGNALRLGHNYVGTEHQLLALFDQPDGVAARVLAEAGLTKADAESRALDLLRAAS